MPRPRVHDLDRVLDVAERLIVDEGAHGLTVRGLSAASGVPNGAIYHAFGSAAALRGRMWLRAATEFLDLQARLLDEQLGTATTPEHDAAVAAVVAAADALAVFAERRPEGARMLLSVHRDQLLGPDLPDDLADSLLGLDRRLTSEVLCRVAFAMWGRRDGPSVEVITTCVVDLPTALLGRALRQPTTGGTAPITTDLRARLAAAVRGILALDPPTHL